MPLFLIPFLVLAAGNTRMHKHQADAALMESETHRMEYELHLREYEAQHHIKVPRAVPAPSTAPTPQRRSNLTKSERPPGTN